MKTLLRIDASIRKQGSFSRMMGNFFEEQWALKYPGSKIIRRDLAEENVPHLNQLLAEAFFRQNNVPEILSLSDTIVDEVKACDTLLITSALYNFSIPSSLKSYLDHLVRINQTFSQSSDGQYRGLLQDKHAVVITSKGGIYKGTSNEYLDYQDPYLKTMLTFIGIEKINMFSIEGTKDVTRVEGIVSKIKLEIRNSLQHFHQRSTVPAEQP